MYSPWQGHLPARIGVIRFASTWKPLMCDGVVVVVFLVEIIVLVISPKGAVENATGSRA
jgi:hypothetical protein